MVCWLLDAWLRSEILRRAGWTRRGAVTPVSSRPLAPNSHLPRRKSVSDNRAGADSKNMIRKDGYPTLTVTRCHIEKPKNRSIWFKPNLWNFPAGLDLRRENRQTLPTGHLAIHGTAQIATNCEGFGNFSDPKLRANANANFDVIACRACRSAETGVRSRTIRVPARDLDLTTGLCGCGDGKLLERVDSRIGLLRQRSVDVPPSRN